MAANNLKRRVRNLCLAGFGGIWIRSREQKFVVDSMCELAEEQGWQLLLWDALTGLSAGHENTEVPLTRPGPPGPPQPASPADALRALALMPIQAADGRTLLLIRNGSAFVTDLAGKNAAAATITFVQAIQLAIEAGESYGRCVVILSPAGAKIPIELDPLFQVIDHELPGPDELWEVAKNIDGSEDFLPKRDTPEGDAIVRGAMGLTRREASGAFALSVGEHNDIRPDALWTMKEAMISKSGALSLYRPPGNPDDQEYKQRYGFASIGGLNAAKEFCLKAFNSPYTDAPLKGLLFTGLSGVGKTMLAKALSIEIGWPMVSLDIGALMGKYVGDTERSAREMFDVIKALGKVVIYGDEIEKALAGAGNSNDSGVMARFFGNLLTFLNDNESGAVFIASMNDVRPLLQVSAGAFVRAERFDAMFFFDLPVPANRDVIWKIYTKRYNLTDAQTKVMPDSADWTGAEIAACCRLSRRLDQTLEETAKLISHVAVTAKEQVAELRDWAKGRCLSADYRGVYTPESHQQILAAEEIKTLPRRRVSRGASTK